jgi:hypothetical protein
VGRYTRPRRYATLTPRACPACPLQASYHELQQTCAVVTQQAALVYGRDDPVAAPAAAVAAAVPATAGKENVRRPVDDGIPRLRAVTAEELESIPKYMFKGRVTLARMQDAVGALNELIGAKYRLLRLPPATLKEPQRRQVQAHRAAEADAPEGVWFVTEDDIKEANSPALRLDPAGRGILCMLRHLGRIQEHRSKGCVRFVLLG